MVSELPEDKLGDLIDAYRKKFGDYPPRHVNHGLDPEGALEKAIKDGTAIPGVLPGSTVRDVQ